MRDVKSLALIAEEQQKVSDRGAIVVRLTAAAFLLALAAGEGRTDAEIADGVVLAVFGVLSLVYTGLFRRKASASSNLF